MAASTASTWSLGGAVRPELGSVQPRPTPLGCTDTRTRTRTSLA